MGEVYRARDPRLNREIAVKVLPGDLASDTGRLKRFEKEARSASALNHPNIVTIYEIGTADSVAYIAMELVEGKDPPGAAFRRPTADQEDPGSGGAGCRRSGPRTRCGHRPPGSKAGKRDGNEGRPGQDPRLRSGEADQVELGSGQETNIPTETGTDAGVILGTVGYMSPEQASGQPVDFRSDQFSFGSILYELVTGKRAFARPTGAQTLAAIIQDEPEPLGTLNPQVPGQLRWLVERCLSKEPEDRYGTTQDLAAELRTIRDHLSETLASEGAGAAPRPRSRALRRWLLPIASLLVASVLATWWAFRSREGASNSSSVRFEQITFAPSDMYSARFAPDGQTIVYGLKPVRRPIELFSTRIGSRESRRLGVAGDIRSISSKGELAILEAVLCGARSVWPSLAGAAARDLIGGVRYADWSPDGKSLAVMRQPGGNNRMEFPIGKILYDVTAAAHRFSEGVGSSSASGQRVAFVAGDRAQLQVVDLTGTGPKTSTRFLVTSSAGRRAATKSGSTRSAHGTTDLYAVTPGTRTLAGVVPGDLHPPDISQRPDPSPLGNHAATPDDHRPVPRTPRDRNLSVRDARGSGRPLTRWGRPCSSNEIEPGWDGPNDLFTTQDRWVRRGSTRGWFRARFPRMAGGSLPSRRFRRSRTSCCLDGPGEPRILSDGGLRGARWGTGLSPRTGRPSHSSAPICPAMRPALYPGPRNGGRPGRSLLRG